MSKNISEYIKKLKENPETSAVGSKWTKDEENQLLKEIENEISIGDIALAHKRTVGSIKARLNDIAMRLLQDGMNIEEVSIKLRIHKEILEIEKERRATKVKVEIEQKNIENQIDDKDKILTVTLLREIRDILLRLEAKLI